MDKAGLNLEIVVSVDLVSWSSLWCTFTEGDHVN